MSQVNSVKDLRNKHAKCLVQNRGQTPLVDIKRSSYNRPRTTKSLKFAGNYTVVSTEDLSLIK